MKLIDVPENLTPIDDAFMSNFDHSIDMYVAQLLRDKPVSARYYGWNFCAECWYADGQYHAAVYRYHVHRATISAKTPKALMEAVSEAFGSE